MTPPIWIDNSQEVQPKFKNMGTFEEDKPSGDGINLLFSGCSITANVGLKDCPNGGWSSYLFEKINCSFNDRIVLIEVKTHAFCYVKRHIDRKSVV